MKNNYVILGNRPVELVVEMGLGFCIAEWMPTAGKLANEYGVLIYERAEINKSEKPECERTPVNIAKELFELLKTVEHKDKVILLAHSQGGLYAQQFARLHLFIIMMAIRRLKLKKSLIVPKVRCMR